MFAHIKSGMWNTARSDITCTIASGLLRAGCVTDFLEGAGAVITAVHPWFERAGSKCREYDSSDCHMSGAFDREDCKTG